MTTDDKKAKRDSLLLPRDFMERVRKAKEAHEKKAGFKVTMQAYAMGLMEKGMGK